MVRGTTWRWAVAGLLLVLLYGALAGSVARQSLSWDEGDHLWAGYQAWHAADFGVNPEHPPLVKELAALPLLTMHLKVPPPVGKPNFKDEAYWRGFAFLFGNGGEPRAEQILFRARMSAALLSVLLGLLVFLAGWEMWRSWAAGIVGLVLVVAEPNLLANGAYVTTDMGVTCFLFATMYAFWRYMQKPGLARMLVLGVAAGCCLASKHSAVLLLPIAVMLLLAELALARGGQARARAARVYLGGAVVATAVAIFVLWSTYGFRYSARPGGAHMDPSLPNYMGPLAGHFEAQVYLWVWKLHLLPESYIYGLSDVRIVSTTWPTYLFGAVYEHGLKSYFLWAFVIKSTAAFLALLVLGIIALAARRLSLDRRVLYFLLPALVYVVFACFGGLNIGGRHILPVYPLLIVFVAGAVVALARWHRGWAWAAGVLVLWHVVSSARSYPNSIAYANEFWGGPTQTYKYLTDSNVDWAQQLLSVKKYLADRGIKECAFAYFAAPVIDPPAYGVPCRVLPNADTMFGHIQVDAPATVHGPLLISAGTLTGYEFGSVVLNPYRSFIGRKPDAVIDDGVFVYNGEQDTRGAEAFGHATRAASLLEAKHADQAYAEAQAATTADVNSFQGWMALGDSAAALAKKEEARAAYRHALDLAHTMEPGAQTVWVPQVGAKLKPLS